MLQTPQPVHFNGFTYKAEKTSILKYNSDGTLVGEIKTQPIHESQLHATGEGIFFKIHEEYYGLLDDLRIRHNLMRLTVDDEVVTEIFEMPLFEIIFVYKESLCAINSNLIYRLENHTFVPIGDADLSLDEYERLLVLMDTQVIPDTLYKPSKYHFEYSHGGATYTYLEQFMFISNERGQVVERRPFGYELKNFELKHLKIGDTVYGFSGEFWAVQELVGLREDRVTVVQTYPAFQAQIATLLDDGGQLVIRQPITNTVEEGLNEKGERTLVFPGGSSEFVNYAIKNDKQQYLAISDEDIVQKVAPLCQYNERIFFYNCHAVLVERNKVKTVVQLPLLVDPRHGVVELHPHNVADGQFLIDGFGFDLSQLECGVAVRALAGSE